MKDVVFVNPCFDYPVTKKNNLPIYNRIWPPLSIANCASILEREGYSVDIIDANAERLSIKETVEKAKDGRKVFITTSSLDRWQCPNFGLEVPVKIAESIQNDTDTYFIGYHGTVRSKEILEISGVDGIILGEPENNIESVVEDPRNAPNLAYINGDEFTINKDKEPIDLNEIPLPALHLLPMERYHYEIMGSNFTLLETSRGCPWSCNFCNKEMYGDSFRKKSFEKVKEEIEYVVEECDVKNLYFIDLEFTINRKLVEKICSFLIEKDYDLNWTCQTRLDTVDKDLLKMMRNAGCQFIHYGVETGSKEILDRIGKDISFEQIRKGIRITKESGIKSICFFMLGFPGETEENMNRTVEFANELNPEFASFNAVKPYPGTSFYENTGDINNLFPEYLRNEYSQEFLRKKINNAYKSFYIRPRYIIKNIFKNPKLLYKQWKLFFNYIFN
ncbi:MAG: radical SAM protein [Candidatus Aenigmatarchaeota archaeon]